MLLDTASAGFNISTPVGIASARSSRSASVREVDAARAAAEMRRARLLRVALLVTMVVWGVRFAAAARALRPRAGARRHSPPMVCGRVSGSSLFGVAP